MFVLRAERNNLTVRQRELLTCGSVNVNKVQIEFSADWDGLERVAVFRAGVKSASVLLGMSAGQCMIPWEVLTAPKVKLFCGIYGTSDGEKVLPTVWADLGWVLTGTSAGSEAKPPTPDLWEQELARKGDALDYTEDGRLGLYAGDNLLSAVAVSGGGAASWRIGHGLKIVDGELSVDTTDDFVGDNTLPMTAAGVQTIVGNIDALLGTI